VDVEVDVDCDFFELEVDVLEDELEWVILSGPSKMRISSGRLSGFHPFSWSGLVELTLSLEMRNAVRSRFCRKRESGSEGTLVPDVDATG